MRFGKQFGSRCGHERGWRGATSIRRDGGWGGGPFGGGWDMGGGGRGGFGRGGPGRGGPGSRGRRMFDGSELQLLLLKLIGDAPRHGYDLIREIEERTGGVYAPSPGVVYPTLTLLDEMGLIEERQAEGTKKQFGVTDAGTAQLETKQDEVAALFARIDALAETRERTDSAPIGRAIMNLRTALHQRLGAGDATRDTVHEAAAILDEATRKIERL